MTTTQEPQAPTPAGARPAPSSRISDAALADLSDAQRAELGSAAREESLGDAPLLTGAVDLSELEREYAQGDQSFVRKIRALRNANRPEGAFMAIYKARGDGDCFYRAFAFAFLHAIIRMNDRPLHHFVLKHLESTHALLSRAGFERDIYLDFWAPFSALLRRIHSTDPQQAELDEPGLVAALNEPETSNSIVVYLRLVASAFLKTNAEEFEPFLFAYEGERGDGSPPSMAEFCANHIEAIGKEADHLAITALTRALLVSLEVVYLSRSTDGDAGGAPAAGQVHDDADAEEDGSAAPVRSSGGGFAARTRPMAMGGGSSPPSQRLSVPGRESAHASAADACEVVRFDLPTDEYAAVGTHARSATSRRPSSTLVALLDVGSLLFRPGHYDVLKKSPRLSFTPSPVVPKAPPSAPGKA